MARLTPDTLVHNWARFDKSMEDGAQGYLDARRKEKTSGAKKALSAIQGFFHGDEGLNRATNLLHALQRTHDHIQSFALLYVVMTSSSSWLSKCIAEQLIEGLFFQSAFVFGRADSRDTLQSQVFNPQALSDSKRDPRALSAESSEAGIITFYEKKYAVTALISDACMGMSAEERVTFGQHVGMFRQSLAAKPAKEVEEEMVQTATHPRSPT